MKKILVILTILFDLASCTKRELYHGYPFADLAKTQETLEAFKNNKTTSDVIITKLGSPTFQETSGLQQKKELFYLEEIFLYKPVIGKKLKEIKVLRLSFNSQDRLEKYDFYKIAPNYQFAKAKTQVKGYEMTFLKQIVKNFEK